jgi:hypothetical protein
MTFLVEAIRCDFQFTELDRLLPVLQTGNMSRANLRDLLISELRFAITRSKTEIFVFLGKSPIVGCGVYRKKVITL